jgi:GNAT superfamily N-acetyltransferase
LSITEYAVNAKLFYNDKNMLSNFLLNYANAADIDWIMASIEVCRFQLSKHQSGQWQSGEPSYKTIQQDILNQRYYVLRVDGQLVGGTAILTHDPAYDQLRQGAWLNQQRYVVLHRFFIAPLSQGKGYGLKLLQEIEVIAKNNPFQVNNIRVDTHALNHPMRQLLVKMAFQRCGEVDLPNAGLRLVYHKIIGDI